jgi:hypothetical protein
MSSRIYKGEQGPHRNTSTPKAIQTTKQDVGYYVHRGLNLSKSCVACTFEFQISATPYLKLTTSSIPLSGQAVKHRQFVFIFLLQIMWLSTKCSSTAYTSPSSWATDDSRSGLERVKLPQFQDGCVLPRSPLAGGYV